MANYDWEEAAKGKREDARLGPGTYRVKCTKVVRGSRSADFTSSAGDPQIMAVLEDGDGAEGSVMFTLSKKASWALARWLSKSGVDLKKMKEDGVEPADFADEETARRYLVGRTTTVKVEAGRDPKYPTITPIDPDPSEAPAAADDELNLDDVPF